MSVVSIKFAGGSYSIACENGQEDHLLELGSILDQKAMDIVGKLGSNPSSFMLLLMTALQLVDELYAANKEELHDADESTLSSNNIVTKQMIGVIIKKVDDLIIKLSADV